MAGFFFLPSFYLANCVLRVCRPQNHPKNNDCSTKYLHQYLADEDISSNQPLHMHGGQTSVLYGCTTIVYSILRLATLCDEAEAMVKLANKQ